MQTKFRATTPRDINGAGRVRVVALSYPTY